MFRLREEKQHQEKSSYQLHPSLSIQFGIGITVNEPRAQMATISVCIKVIK